MGRPYEPFRGEGIAAEEETANAVLDDLSYHIRNHIDALALDPQGRYNDELIRGYVAVLDLMRGFTDGTERLSLSRGFMAKRAELGDEFYLYNAVNFQTVAGKYSAKIEIHPKLLMKSAIDEREKSGNSQQRIRFEVTPLDPTIGVATQVRVDLGSGETVDDFQAYHPGRRMLENIIDEKAPEINKHLPKGTELRSIDGAPPHHTPGVRIVEPGEEKNVRHVFESVLRRIESHARTLESRPS